MFNLADYDTCTFAKTRGKSAICYVAVMLSPGPPVSNTSLQKTVTMRELPLN
jgi:hypothetical protein